METIKSFFAAILNQALVVSSKCNWTRISRLLIWLGADIHKVFSSDPLKTPASIALDNQNYELAAIMLKSDNDFKKYINFDYYCFNSDYDTLKKHSSIRSWFVLSNNGPLNLTKRLVLAILLHNIPLVKFLINSLSKEDAKDIINTPIYRDDSSAITISIATIALKDAQTCSYEILNILYDAGLDINARPGNNPFLVDFSVNEKDCGCTNDIENKSYLSIAAEYSNKEAIKFLIEKGAVIKYPVFADVCSYDILLFIINHPDLRFEKVTLLEQHRILNKILNEFATVHGLILISSKNVIFLELSNILTCLVEKGLCLEAQDWYGDTILHKLYHSPLFIELAQFFSYYAPNLFFITNFKQLRPAEYIKEAYKSNKIISGNKEEEIEVLDKAQTFALGKSIISKDCLTSKTTGLDIESGKHILSFLFSKADHETFSAYLQKRDKALYPQHTQRPTHKISAKAT